MKSNKFVTPTTKQEAINEAILYYRNAKEVLKKSTIEFGIYKEPKYVKEASSMAYLACLRAIDSYLLAKGVPPDKLPTSIAEYLKELRKIPRNGKLMAAMTVAYQNLHILGYYRGGVGVEMIKEGFKNAKFIIDKLAT